MKWNIIISLLFVLGVGTVLIGASSEKEHKLYKPIYKNPDIPEGWPQPPRDNFKNNPVTEAGFELGKKIFYDSRLSSDGEVSCGSCHQHFAAFASLDHDLSHGVGNRFTTRNAPALINLIWMNEYHWDGGVNHLEVQALSPITAENEMNQTLENVLVILKTDTLYQRMFYEAFGTAKVNSEKMLKAIAQFTGSLISANSKYDRVMHGVDSFTLVEQQGYQLFKQHCSSCHAEPLFTNNQFMNNGLTLNRLNDLGRMGITGNPKDSLLFKVPTLRNVQVSYPYMHDGRLYALPNVLDHYTSLDTANVLLDKRLKNPISLNEKEKKILMYFLFTLTDSSFIHSERFKPEIPIFIKH